MKINELHTELQSKANHQDMIRGYVKKDAFTELMKSLGEEVDRKSTIEEMRRQENEIQVEELISLTNFNSLSSRTFIIISPHMIHKYKLQ